MPLYFRLLKYLFFKKYPAEITFFVTAACNFRCNHCFTLEKIEKARPKNELSLHEIKKITQTIPPFLRLTISGGEPFLRTDLFQICQSFYKHCHVKFITIPTNASLPEKIVETTEKIVQHCPKAFVHISLSLDDIGEKRDNIVGRQNTFPLLIETAHKLKELKKTYSNLGLGVITTQTGDNEKGLDEIYDFAIKKLGVDNFGFNIARSYQTGKRMHGPDVAIYEKFTQRLVNEKKSSGFTLPFSSFIVAKRNIIFGHNLALRQGKKHWIPCYSGGLRIVIDEMGNIYPCETLQYSTDSQNFIFGNLRDYDLDFKKVFFAPQAQKVRKYIKETKCLCAHECDLETNIIFNPRFLPRILLEALKSISRH